MDSSTLDSLGFDFIRDSVSSHTYTEMGARRADLITSQSNIESIKTLYSEVDDLMAFYDAGYSLPLGGIDDVTSIIGKGAPSGAYLFVEDILKVRSTLTSIVSLKSLSKESSELSLSHLTSYLDSLSKHKELLRELNRAIDEKGEITDDASFELYDIRQSLKSSRTRARTKLDSMINDKKYEGFFQDDIFTIREDRYVLIVKAEYHTKIPGVLHGKSGTGQTYFVEPYDIVELNNSLSILKKDEKREEEKVLKNLTKMIVGSGEVILDDIKTAGIVDFTQAKAKFAISIDGTIPSLKKPGDGAVKLLKARHPELVLQGGIDAVAIDIGMEEGDKVLIISGANTGGKTVALKTLGLLTLMAMSGIPVSAEKDSEVVVFEKIFSDIGDSQGIAESLSTFSAHLTRLGDILKEADSESLILIDEIGVGTDPVEGGVLSLVILEELSDRGAVTAVTTHTNMLKIRAQVGKGFRNASVEFDEKNMKPFYKLIYDIPGQSFGLTVAEKYGIPAGIIDKAREKLKGYAGTELSEAIKEMEDQSRELKETQKRLSELKEKHEQELKLLENEKKNILKKAKEKADSVLNEASAEINELIRKARAEETSEILKGKDKERLTEIGEKVKETFAQEGLEEKHYMPVAGDVVRLGVSTGTVDSVDREKETAEVMVGGRRVKAPFKSLAPSEEKPRERKGKTEYRTPVTDSVTKINLIGMRVEEAEKVLVKSLDEALVAGAERVEIIHGLGTGVLAKFVGEFLKDYKAVKSFKRGDELEGGAGVTIVSL